ncbi:MAG: transglutaminase TgpA family protein [Planctomycetota bacterium]
MAAEATVRIGTQRHFGNVHLPGHRRTQTVLIAMTAVSLPVLWQGGLPLLPLMIAMVFWRLRQDGRDWRVPRMRTRALLIAPVVAIVLATGGFGMGRPTAMLVCAVWLKLVEMRRDHDYHVQVQFCLLLITAQMLAAIDPFTTAYAAGSFLVCLTCLQRTSDPAAVTLGWTETIRHSLAVLLKALPVALVVFLLIPRGGVQFGFNKEQARTGVTDSLDPAAFTDLADDDSKAFSVSFPDGVVPPRPLWYWRGPVLMEVDDGHRWTGRESNLARSGHALRRRDPAQSSWRQQILLAPHHQRWLFALDHPVQAQDDILFHFGHNISFQRAVDGRLAYNVTSDAGPVPSLYPDLHQYALQLPGDLDTGVLALAERLRRDQARDTADAIMDWLRSERFIYTRSPGRMDGDPTATFLFRRKAGFCGHYASAFALLMRAAGHPARVVVGYRGGVWNPYGAFVDVRQKNAHSWCEIYSEGLGWVRVDPTEAAISPDGSGTGLDALSPEEELQATAGEGSLWVTASLLYDFVDRTWYRFVLSYDEHVQQWFLDLLGLQSWVLIAAIPVVGGVVVLLAWLAVRLLPAGSRPRDPVLASWMRFCERAAAIGCRRRAHEGPADFAVRVRSASPGAATAVDAFVAAYIAARYGPPDQAPDARRLRRLLRDCRLRRGRTRAT